MSHESLLRVTKHASVREATVGDSIEYTITIRNVGPVEARQIGVPDLLQSASSFIGGRV